MKKILLAAALMVALSTVAGCGNGAKNASAANDSDSVAVDTLKSDSDSAAAKTAPVKADSAKVDSENLE